MQDLLDFLEPIPIHEINADEGYYEGQLARHVAIYQQELPDINDASIVIIGAKETRGESILGGAESAANEIRKELYKLHYWHTDIKICDLGNVKNGANISDSYAALKTVIAALIEQKKTVVIIGGSHDVTLAQYNAYRHLNLQIEATCIDAKIDLQSETPIRSDNFLMEMLTGDPSMVKHYNHLGFQSYLVHPKLLETMDKLRFDCYRLGTVLELMEEMEPVLRNSHLVSFDICAIKNADAPANTDLPNGFTGVEACMLARYAGMSDKLQSFGIYGYRPEHDRNALTAKQVAQMLWYFIDGKNKSLNEAAYGDKHNFIEFHTAFAEVDTMFLQSKKTGRWWMQMPNNKLIACSFADYKKASQNQIPERWLRVQERS
ncbi:MAG: formimidoylglutamase [Chitinophagaceae bacterium]|jgi:arginase family enzyme|nr:formimidoylglutamase [Chitinophagaceae bacterium]MBP6046643.1 formimidoylglutamase [Ferruginibacter sp.]NMD28780.1 formimidoylglutamase [Bacteroidota bacterium]MBK7345697.1 formimidoylglutamase [Chitinophagaceae bacterium]MBK7734811.1 formimidoylglutamase [Chitinophagaceae bacterium]